VLAVTAADVLDAAERIADDVVRTRSAVSRTLSAITGATVVVKFENEQFTGAFKDRGAANRLRLLDDDQRQRGVIALSAGNHAQGVAYHAGRFAIPATIVMPATAPFTKVRDTEAHGARVVQVGATLAEAAAALADLEAETGAVRVHPYDDPAVIAGQGTVAVEMLADHPDLDALVVPTGGGGLLAGMATHARAVVSDVELIGVQSAVYPGMVEALAGRTLDPPAADTLADGIAVKTPGELTVPIVADLVDDVITVEEATIERAMALFLEIEKTVAEGAAAAALAALLEDPDRFRGRRVGVVLSGGNVDTRVLASVLMRELVHSGRILTLRIAIADSPGRLAPVIEVVAAAGANIVEIDHRRLFDPISARSTAVDLVLEVRDDRHGAAVVAALDDAGHTVAVNPT